VCVCTHLNLLLTRKEESDILLEVYFYGSHTLCLYKKCVHVFNHMSCLYKKFESCAYCIDF